VIRIGSRGSQLALWQANHIADKLRTAGEEVTVTIIKTTGDQIADRPLHELAGKGVFTKELEDALAENIIDLAVHSLKDLPTTMPPGFAIAAIPPREDPRDALLSAYDFSLATLPQNAKVATGSLRRQSQLLYLRRDLDMQPIRGNIDTRLRKLVDGQLDALILAAAGIRRINRTELLRELIAPSIICPSPGQGALALEIRDTDAALQARLQHLDDSATRFAVTAERVVLASLGGGCSVPIGANCIPVDGQWLFSAAVGAAEGTALVRLEKTVPIAGANADRLGREVAEQLIAQGAAEILREQIA
jgi:hydroxymethylbilane synthase